VGDLCQRVERDGRVVGIEQPVDAGAAGIQAFSHFDFADLLPTHCLFQFMGDLELDRRRAAIFKNSLLGQKIFEIGPDMFALYGIT
jgi:hypothetical protein